MRAWSSFVLPGTFVLCAGVLGQRSPIDTVEKGLSFSCFTTNLNADDGTDSYDMVLYNDLFLSGHRRADTDANDQIDTTDMANFIDAYDAATGP